MSRETLAEFLAEREDLVDTFLTYDDGYRSRSRRYVDVARAARRLGARLHEAGLRKGDKVLIWSENRPEWVAALWACLALGIVVVPLDYRSSPDFLRRVHGVIGAKLLVAGEEVADLSGILDIPVWPVTEMEWPDGDVPPLPSVPLGKDDIAEILFTSGATAEPKGVLITHRNLLANIVPVEKEILKHRRYSIPFRPLRFLNLLPLSHLFGQTMAAFIPAVLPGEVVFLKSYHPQEIARQVRLRRISVIVCVPKILELLRDYAAHVDPTAVDAPASGLHWTKRWWRYRALHRLFGFKFWCFVVGAAPLPPELEAFWSRLGFLVVQGYGLTETAPVVTVNHPFHAQKGTVGKPIAGVEVKIAEDGEILVRGENVTQGYVNAGPEATSAFRDGWFYTGDIGEMNAQGQLVIKGRKKEMIVTPEGLNVFPEDVERALLAVAGVKDAAVVGAGAAGAERVHAVLALQPGTTADIVVRDANRHLEDHQRVRGYAVWPGDELPRTEGTRKLRRRELKEWLANGGGTRPESGPRQDRLADLLTARAGGRPITDDTTLEELGLSSLERVQLLLELEEVFSTTVDEAGYAAARTVGDLRRVVTSPVLPAGTLVSGKDVERTATPPGEETIDFPRWQYAWWADLHRRFHLPLWVLPLARVFAWVSVEGREHLNGLTGPVIFAPNHQSYFDTPIVFMALPSRYRYRVAPSMSKEFFKAHFYPQQYGRWAWFTNSLNYYLSALMFHGFPFPQREAGLRQALRYAGELVNHGRSILIFPEGRHSLDESVGPFLPGVGLLASRLKVPVVPVRIRGANQVLHPKASMARPGRVRVTFGAPLHLEGDDYAELARRVGEAVRGL